MGLKAGIWASRPGCRGEAEREKEEEKKKEKFPHVLKHKSLAPVGLMPKNHWHTKMT